MCVPCFVIEIMSFHPVLMPTLTMATANTDHCPDDTTKIKFSLTNNIN